MDGLILVHKPKGVTSHDIVIRIRKNLHVKKVGHFGTLDPLATGLLLIAVGKATRLFPFYLRSTKTYLGQIRLGYSTDTYDAEGKPASEESKNYPDNTKLLEIMNNFLGETEQLPPPYSAKKYKGEALYKRVRGQKEYELKSTNITVYFFRLKMYSPPYMEFEIKCSSGTYIRSIAHDLGKISGCGAHLNSLLRTEIGEFHIDKSHTVEEIEKMASVGHADKFLHPLEVLLPEFPKIIVKDNDALRIRNGSPFIPDIMPLDPSPKNDTITEELETQSIFRIFDSREKLIAFATKEAQKKSLRPFLVFDSKNYPQ